MNTDDTVFVLTKTFTTCDGTDTEVYGVFPTKESAKESMLDLIKDTFADTLNDIELMCDEDEDADVEIQNWIDDRFNSPTIWCDEDDDCSTIIIIHSTEMV